MTAFSIHRNLRTFRSKPIFGQIYQPPLQYFKAGLKIFQYTVILKIQLESELLFDRNDYFSTVLSKIGVTPGTPFQVRKGQIINRTLKINYKPPLSIYGLSYHETTFQNQAQLNERDRNAKKGIHHSSLTTFLICTNSGFKII